MAATGPRPRRLGVDIAIAGAVTVLTVVAMPSARPPPAPTSARDRAQLGVSAYRSGLA